LWQKQIAQPHGFYRQNLGIQRWRQWCFLLKLSHTVYRQRVQNFQSSQCLGCRMSGTAAWRESRGLLHREMMWIFGLLWRRMESRVGNPLSTIQSRKLLPTSSSLLLPFTHDLTLSVSCSLTGLQSLRSERELAESEITSLFLEKKAIQKV
jgi:hypothetical protein